MKIFNIIISVLSLGGFITLSVLWYTGHIVWSWWWITAPIWVPALLAIGVTAWALWVLKKRG